MRASHAGPDGPPVVDLDTVALVSALRFAGWKGVPLRLELLDGSGHQVGAPIIIGDDFVQFADETGGRPVRVPFRHIAAFALL